MLGGAHIRVAREWLALRSRVLYGCNTFPRPEKRSTTLLSVRVVVIYGDIPDRQPAIGRGGCKYFAFTPGSRSADRRRPKRVPEPAYMLYTILLKENPLQFACCNRYSETSSVRRTHHCQTQLHGRPPHRSSPHWQSGDHGSTSPSHQISPIRPPSTCAGHAICEQL